MFKGKKGYIWCIEDGIHIMRISPTGKVIRYDQPLANKASEIYHLEYGKDGAVWLGTDQGIFVLH